MTMPHEDARIAILIANGFNEPQITAVQRMLTQDKRPHDIIAPEQGLVNSWRDNNWGHHFPVDQQIGTAMGSDYEYLILAGGTAGVEKLKTNPHTRRIINHFLEAKKPVAAIGEGVKLLALSPKSAGLSVAAPESCKEELKASNIELLDAPLHQDETVLTSTGENIEAWTERLTNFFQRAEIQDQQAA
ncbi:MAG: DJ-1/PfpI family protein [Bdellovibrionales bacterium]